MTELTSRLLDLESEALGALDAAATGEELEALRITFLGRKDGRISSILRMLGSLPPDERKAVGAEANRVRDRLEAGISERLAGLEGSGPAEAGLDVSLPGRGSWVGGLHPVTRALEEVCAIFESMGFVRARGPEAETEWYNFVALNTPLDHPAADEQDTLYLEGGGLLRSHTSPVQIRVMQDHRPPIRILAPGMVYRRDAWDATHAPAFAQLEGLVVDEGITFVDFKATLAEFARRFWGPGTQVRLRPSFFPFTEPSAEVDVRRIVTLPDGTVSDTGWTEIMGAGMVDPAVLENVGIDPERYSGFAFGMGPGRIAMRAWGIPDLRLLHDSDVRFLRQFAR